MTIRTQTPALAAMIVMGTLLGGGCRPPAPPPPLAPCETSPDAFTQETRLGAMLSVHAYAYYRPAFPPFGRGMPELNVQPLRKAVEVLRCDPSPGAWSRRRRAIAKLLAYGWPDPPDRALIEGYLGANVDAIVQAMRREYGKALDTYLKPYPVRLETSLLQILASQPGKLMRLPTGAPELTPSECAQKWKPVQDPSHGDDSSSVAIHTHISIDGMSRDQVAKNVDPQRWDECSKFWPTPPPESTCLATVTYGMSLSDKCKIKSWACTTPLPIGKPYPSPRLLYEHFVCKQSPCDCEFENVLKVWTGLVPHQLTASAATVQAFQVVYGLAVCPFEKFEGAMSGQIGTNTSVRASTDRGWMDVWEEGGATHVEANKFVSFTNLTNTGTAGAILGFVELNEELAELACCLDGKTM